MASFNTTGIEGLSLSLEEIADLPEEILQKMLEAQGEIVVAAHRKKIREMFVGGTGALADSITAFKKMGVNRGRPMYDEYGYVGNPGVVRYIRVYPAGKRGSYNRKSVTKTYKRSKRGRTYTVGGDVKDVTNGDVGFVLEYGAPQRGIAATQWMRYANEECGESAVRAAAEVYDGWLKSKDL